MAAGSMRIARAEPGRDDRTKYVRKVRISMLPPILFSKQHRSDESDEEVAEWEAQQAKLGKDYYESPWLSALVTFSGFVAAFIGSFALLLVVANLRHGTVWVPYAVILAALVAGHLCLRAVLYRVRRLRAVPPARRRAGPHIAGCFPR